MLQSIVWIALAAAPAAPAAPPADPGPRVIARFGGHETAGTDTVRHRAIEHSDFYYKRLTVHRYASYATIPLFVTEYVLGQSLFNKEARNEDTDGPTKSAHGIVAGSIGVLFGVNTITGVWNLWDARHDPHGGRRWLHSGLMIAADAGFVWAGATAPSSEHSTGAELSSQRNKHRAIALSSMGVSLASYLMMLVWKD